MLTPRNLIHAEAPADGPGETMEPLLTRDGLLLERIVSRGCPTSVGEWYDQEHDEWVLLAAGTATLEFETQAPLRLAAGDYLMLPAHVRHRVAEVSGDAVWLALHLRHA
jgi:cupin 2 domain-containing protein